MKKKNREINIFNLSMLDVIMSAMGAFLIIMVVLLPYYKKDAQTLMAEIRQQQQELARQQEEIQRQQSQNRNLQEQLNNTFLIIVINWNTKEHDIDLHVIDPEGHLFKQDPSSEREFTGVPGKLSEDTTKGPGVEVWEIAKARPGTYKIYYKFFAKHGNIKSTEVKGRVYFRDGTKHFRTITLQNKNDEPLAATITVKNDGQVIIN